MQDVADNIGSIIETVQETLKAFSEGENPIEIVACDPMCGVVEECGFVNNWHNFEVKLFEIMKCFPNYEEIGHNHGLTFIHQEQFLYDSSQEYMEKIIMPTGQDLAEDANVELYPLGICLSVYHKGDKLDTIETTFSRIREYMDNNHIQIRGDIVITSIVGPFIVNNPREYLYWIRIPIIDA